MGNGSSVRTRLMLVIVLILVSGFLITNIISFRVSASALKETILHNELPLTSSNIYSEIQADLLRPVFVSSLMSNDTFLKDWLLNGEEDLDGIVRYLQELRLRYDVFTSFFISEKSRRYYHFSGVAQVIDESDPEDAWYFRVRDMQAPYEINIDFDYAQSNTVTIFVNYRVLDYAGDFIGVTGVGLRIDSVAQILARYGRDYSRNVYFVDRTGRIAVRSGTTAVLGENIRDAAGIADIAQGLLDTDHGFYEYSRDGQTMLVTARHIPELGWHVVVEQNEADALRSLRASFFTNLAIGSAIIALTIAIIAYAVNIFQKKLEEMATVDKLTGIANRQVFDAALDHAVKMQQRNPQPLSVIMFDIDHFKRVNDTAGHLAGDTVIRKVAQIICGLVREVDVVCRWGGEEIIILANNCALDDAVVVAEKLRMAVAEASVCEFDREIRITVSGGVAEYAPGDRAETLVGRVDAALYRAKHAGRNRIVADRAVAAEPVA